MTVATRGPRLQKGALVGVNPLGARIGSVVFQYNPDSMVRTITPNGAADQGDINEALRLKGPPTETIALDAALDATDQLEAGHTPAGAGLHSALSALELLLYPSSVSVIANEALSTIGLIEVLPALQPLTLFVWGSWRVVPVRITGLTITEEAFDAELNPILASVKLTLQVQNYQDLGLLSPGGAMFLAHQVVKEVLAGMSGNVSDPVSAVASIG